LKEKRQKKKKTKEEKTKETNKLLLILSLLCKETIIYSIFSTLWLTLILLTLTKWWAPAGASKRQMGFNSAFKGLKCSNRLTALNEKLERS
jgi:endonuclease/exonuclease/phosphatase (EEP) superfamily protein YafD